MNKSSTSAIAAAMLLSATCAFAQDTTPSPSGSAGAIGTGATGKGASMQGCRDQANTAKGEKRNDTPMNADTDKACADMTKKNSAHKKTKGTAASAAM